jgi:UDP-3-O-[3-hydroxymyristoyl] glucosamine N-acyltransferase
MCNFTILGSVKIGYKNTLGAGNMIRESIKVGSKNFISMRSSVLKDVLDKEVWYSSPAKLQSNK